MQNILNLYQNKALKEMETIITRLGGREKNPKLSIIIDNKKDEFRLAFLNAEIKALEQGGDRTTANKLATERNKLAKQLDAKWNLENVEYAEVDVGNGNKYKVGLPYRYKTEEGGKSIKIIRKSDKPGYVVASYNSGPTKGKEQNFQVANIETGFKPEIDKQYNYYSQTNDKTIRVKVISDLDKKGMVEVQVGENKFKVHSGALMDITKKEAALAPEETKKTKKVITPTI
jgi:hypothetical protein